MKERKIIQILPADGWKAMFGPSCKIPLIGWAIVNDQQKNKVVGLVQDFSMNNVVFADEESNFNGYTK